MFCKGQKGENAVGMRASWMVDVLLIYLEGETNIYFGCYDLLSWSVLVEAMSVTSILLISANIRRNCTVHNNLPLFLA